MKPRSARFAALSRRGGRASTLSLFLTCSRPALPTRGARAKATAEQRGACTPDVYRLCVGEIHNVRAITACLRRQRMPTERGLSFRYYSSEACVDTCAPETLNGRRPAASAPECRSRVAAKPGGWR
jgi:hypothetical protein